MTYDIFNKVHITCNREIEAPVLVHTSLPDISELVVLLRMQRWVLEIVDQKPKLLVQSQAHILRRLRPGYDRLLGQDNFHLVVLGLAPFLLHISL